MFKQFEIRDENKRIIAGWASVMIKDLQGDIVPVEELERAMYNFMDRGGHIIFGHQNKPVGKVLRWEIKEHPETGKPGLWIVAKIFNDYPLDDKVWEMIKAGVLKGFSIGGAGKPKKKLIKENGQSKEVTVIEDIQLMEISIVEQPANPYAKIEYVNYFAKGDVESKEKWFEKREDGWYEVTSTGEVRKVANTDEEFEEIVKKERATYLVNILKSKVGVEREVDEVVAALEAVSECSICKGVLEEYTDEIAEEVFGKKYEELEDAQKQTVKQIIRKMQEVIALFAILGKRDVNYMPEDYPVEEEAEKELSKEDIEKKRKIDRRYMEESGRFKEMTCPDDPSQKNRFCGCVRYMMNVKGLSLDSAKRLCGYIKHYVKKESSLSITEVYDLVADFAKSMEEYVEVRKPFAGFKNFDDCVKKMKEQGYSDDSAHRICGKLYWEYEGKKGEVSKDKYSPLSEVMSKVARGEKLNETEKKILAAAIDAAKKEESSANEDTLSKIMSKVARGEKLSEKESKILAAAVDAAKKAKDEMNKAILEGIEKAIDSVWETYILVKGLKDKVDKLVKELGQYELSKDLRPPKRWWNRCMDELNNERLCAWVYWHHLKPHKPESKKEPDKPSTREARQRKRKWLEERKKGDVDLVIREVAEYVKSVNDIMKQERFRYIKPEEVSEYQRRGWKIVRGPRGGIRAYPPTERKEERLATEEKKPKEGRVTGVSERGVAVEHVDVSSKEGIQRGLEEAFRNKYAHLERYIKEKYGNEVLEKLQPLFDAMREVVTSANDRNVQKLYNLYEQYRLKAIKYGKSDKTWDIAYRFLDGSVRDMVLAIRGGYEYLKGMQMLKEGKWKPLKCTEKDIGRFLSFKGGIVKVWDFGGLEKLEKLGLISKEEAEKLVESKGAEVNPWMLVDKIKESDRGLGKYLEEIFDKAAKEGEAVHVWSKTFKYGKVYVVDADPVWTGEIVEIDRGKVIEDLGENVLKALAKKLKDFTQIASGFVYVPYAVDGKILYVNKGERHLLRDRKVRNSIRAFMKFIGKRGKERTSFNGMDENGYLKFSGDWYVKETEKRGKYWIVKADLYDVTYYLVDSKGNVLDGYRKDISGELRRIKVK